MLRLPDTVAAVLADGGTVVLPSRQRAHAVRLAHAAAQLAAGRRAWQTPDVLELTSWQRREVERRAAAVRLPRLLSPVQEAWLWRQAAREATRELPLINRGALAQALQRAAGLAALHRIDCARWPQPAGGEGALLAAVQREVHERAAAAGGATLPQLIEPPEGAACPPGPLLFAGFVQPPAQVAALAASRPAPGLPPLAQAPPHASSPEVILCADEDSELEEIARWCRTRATPGSRLLVMMPGSPGRRERLAGLIRQTLDPGGWLAGGDSREQVVVEGGSPLARLPAIAHALTSLALLAGDRVEMASLGDWLRAPFFSHPSSARHALLDVWLAESGVPGLSLAGLLNALRQAPKPLSGVSRELARRLRAAAALLGAEEAAPREWAQRLKEALQHLGWPGSAARDRGGRETVARFTELLEETGSLALLVGQLSLKSLLGWLAELAARTAFRPADQDPVVTIVPRLIDPVVQVDALWVAGLTADSFPEPVQADPWLPLAAQVAAGVPAASSHGRLAEARALLSAWRAATCDLSLSVPLRANDLELLPSPLLAGWPVTSRAPQPSIWLPLQLHRDEQLESCEDARGQPWPLGEALPSGTRALELQNQCPFRAYAELRLGARELRAPQPGVPPDLRGQLLHGALQRLWTQLNDWRGLASLAEESLQRLIGECVDASVQALMADRLPESVQSPALARERERSVRLIGQLCMLERTRAPFTVAGTELDTRLALGGHPVRMRIDRVDALEEGGRAVLDYKSGQPAAADWYGARPSHPQLLAYLAAAGGDVVALATVNINARELRFEGVAEAADLLPRVRAVAAQPGQTAQAAWQSQREHWRACVEQLAAGFAAGEAAVDPRHGACEHCHLTAVCRIAERGATPEAGEAEAIA